MEFRFLSRGCVDFIRGFGAPIDTLNPKPGAHPKP